MMRDKMFDGISFVSFVLLLFFVSSNVERVNGNTILSSFRTPKETRNKNDQNRKKKKPLQVFLLIGQSNMQGHGYSDRKDANTGIPLNGTLDWLINQKEYSDVHLKDNSTSDWIQRDDVWIAYNKQRYINDTLPEVNAHGKLTVGPYGGDPGQMMQIGPELGFGFTIGDAIGAPDDRQVLLLKIAWGGKSLAVDFRPPSSSGTANEGLYYRATMNNINKTLADLKSLFPSYCDDDDDDRACSCNGYEIAGFAWHQGWNDGCDKNMVLEYEYNLVNLIRDIRNDLNLPKLPVSIAVSGMCGYRCSGLCGSTKERKARDDLVEAQLAVSNNPDKYPDFKDTVISVDTRMFARKEMPFSPGNQIYHWHNNCESYWLIGKAMGKAMLQLLDKNSTTTINTTTDGGATNSNLIENCDGEIKR